MDHKTRVELVQVLEHLGISNLQYLTDFEIFALANLANEQLKAYLEEIGD